MTRESARKRRRATVVAAQDGRLLLVKERGAHRFSLPGGGIERREGVIEAACRELREETGLCVLQAKYLFDHEGRVRLHKVVVADVQGDVRLQRRELSDFLWWDGKGDIPMLASARSIIQRAISEEFHGGRHPR